MKRAPFTAAIVCLALAPSSRVARADDAGAVLHATATCEASPAPGRFRCDVAVRTPQGTTMTWADVVVLEAADFILPLRGRVGPRDATAHEPDIYRWALGFVAKTRGAGDIVFGVRAAVCKGESCEGVETRVTGHVVVGSP
jgi:hypothetical protein